MVVRKKKSMDANNAAAWVSYAFTDVAGIYPITPSSPMADYVDQWAAHGQKNIFGNPVKVVEMQSEAGAAGTVHGSLAAGALTTTYTASQGLLLMIPNLYKIAGELLPGVLHVAARALTTQALNIFGDHEDVMACRQTGFAMLAEANPQEVMDLAPVAHLAAIKGRVPFMNFFDGFRTSHEIQKLSVWDYKDLADMVDMDAVKAFRDHALNPAHGITRGSHENDDTFFQHREACNKYYEAIPDIVEAYMNQINEKLGTDYKPFNYYGAPDAENVVIAIGSINDVLSEVVDYKLARGEKVGMVNVHLYRPFAVEKLLSVLPESVKKIAVLDRTKEPGALGEPLYLDVVTALATHGKGSIKVIGGRYGLGSKDTPPASMFAVFKELEKDEPKEHFTVGINDDVTYLSLPEEEAPNTAAEGTVEVKFWGLGGDGTVGANKNSIKIIGDHTDKYVQAYFQYDSKKTGGVTVSHLRFGDKPIRSPYYINKADFVACHNPSYITKHFPIVKDIKDGGTFLINCQWTFEELEHHLAADAKKYIYDHKINVYMINAIDLAAKVGMGKRTNTVLQSAFFALANVLPADEAIKYMKDAAEKSYLKKGRDVVDKNWAAIDAGATAFTKCEIPESWANPAPDAPAAELTGRPATVKLVKEVMEPINAMNGYSLPVSAFCDVADGTFPNGASAYEKRGVAVNVVEWNPAKCIACNQCSFSCPHATIRAYALDEAELAAAPANIKTAEFKVGPGKGKYKFALAVSPLDCMGCGVCAGVCPTKSLTMVPMESQLDQQPVFDYCVDKVSVKKELVDNTVKGSQFNTPLLEFSGSCAGCAESTYARVLTQLFGDRMFISNATGCSSIWGGPAATSPYTVNKEGKGPAWANSLFEDNAEHGFGMYLGQKALRDALKGRVEALAASDEAVKAAADKWIETYTSSANNQEPTKALIAALEANGSDEAKSILEQKDYLNKKSVWVFGGDGWAYDIGYGGVDHVLASGEDINIFVFDTEVYSNTGGQASKSTNIGAVAQFAAAGKEVAKKSLSEIQMQYGYVYVAQIAMGANPAQCIKAMVEAEAYPGPSLIIGYSPCELHSIKGGMTNCQKEMKKAVECGYWNLFRYNPASDKPFTLDSKEPKPGYRDFMMGEARFSGLTRSFPERAEKLFQKSEDTAMARYEHLTKLGALYNE